MSEVPFHHTRMGVRFYEVDVPKLIAAVERLANAVEMLVDVQSQGAKNNEQADQDSHNHPLPIDDTDAEEGA